MIGLAEILSEKGVSPSVQRLKVYEFLKQTKSHPRVFDIYQSLKSEIPSLSKTTVYNALKVLVSKGLVNELHIDSNECRYDAFTDEHGHFKCKICGAISDVHLSNNIGNFQIGDKQIDAVELNLIGICELCVKLN